MTDASPSKSPTPQPANAGVNLLVWLVTAGMVVLTAVLAMVARSRTTAEPEALPPTLTNVEVMTIVPEEYEEALVLPARLVADREAVVSSEVSGTLKRWLVTDGATVAAGQLVAELESDAQEARLVELEALRAATAAGITVAQESERLAKVGLEQAHRDVETLKLELKSAQSNLDLVVKDFGRVEGLARDKIGTQSELDAAVNRKVQAELTVAKAEDLIAKAAIAARSAEVGVAQARANVELSRARLAEKAAAISAARVALAKTRLAAPLAGRLDKCLVEPGEVVAIDQELARIYDLEHVRAQVDVPDRYVPFLDQRAAAVDKYVAWSMPGAKRRLDAKLLLPGLPKLTGGTHRGLEFAAEIAYISQASDPISNTFTVELRLPNPGGALKPGIIGRARIVYLVYPQALVIPMRAVQVSDVGPRVLVAEDRDGLTYAAVRDIQPASIKDDRILVSKGLTAGERLVVVGGKGAVHGEELNVIKQDGVLRSDPSAITDDQQLDAPAPLTGIDETGATKPRG